MLCPTWIHVRHDSFQNASHGVWACLRSPPRTWDLQTHAGADWIASIQWWLVKKHHHFTELSASRINTEKRWKKYGTAIFLNVHKTVSDKISSNLNYSFPPVEYCHHSEITHIVRTILLGALCLSARTYSCLPKKWALGSTCDWFHQISKCSVQNDVIAASKLLLINCMNTVCVKEKYISYRIISKYNIHAISCNYACQVDLSRVCYEGCNSIISKIGASASVAAKRPEASHPLVSSRNIMYLA